MEESGNTAVVRQLVEAFNTREFARAERLYAPDYVNRSPLPLATFQRETLGTSGMRGLVDAVPDAQSEIVQLVDKGDKVVLHTLVRGTTRDGGAFSLEFMNVFRLDGGKICESWSLVDALRLMRELGVRPQPTTVQR
jgi:predicted SnoaL-like aldol condensation-catalyzing enzyme